MSDHVWLGIIIGSFVVLFLAGLLPERPWVKKRYRCGACGTVIERRISPYRRHMRWESAVRLDGYDYGEWTSCGLFVEGRRC